MPGLPGDEVVCTTSCFCDQKEDLKREYRKLTEHPRMLPGKLCELWSDSSQPGFLLMPRGSITSLPWETGVNPLGWTD